MLLAGPLSHTSIQHFVETFHWICILFVLLILVSIDPPLCIVGTLFQNAVIRFLESSLYKIVLFFIN